jgi:hypothetical protein
MNDEKDDERDDEEDRNQLEESVKEIIAQIKIPLGPGEKGHPRPERVSQDRQKTLHKSKAR